jgi:hypothetical protein
MEAKIKKIPKSEDMIYMDGNTTVEIISPKITDEERLKNWEELCRTASQIVENMIERNEL